MAEGTQPGVAATSASSKAAAKPTAAARKKTPRSGVQLMASAVFVLLVVLQCVLPRLLHLATALLAHRRLTRPPCTPYTLRQPLARSFHAWSNGRRAPALRVTAAEGHVEAASARVPLAADVQWTRRGRSTGH
jgi:hypothetical protein